MTVPMPEPYVPAAPDPTSPTRWGAPVQDYAGRPDGSAPSGWADAVAPVVAMPVIEPASLRVGWLTGQAPEGPDAA